MRPQSIIMRALAGMGLFLMLILLAFGGLPLLPNNTKNTLYRMELQATLCERIAKDALLLSQPAYRVQAIAELQKTLPYWEEAQAGLQHGDQALGISSNLPSDIELLILQSQSDYSSIDAAAHVLLQAYNPVEIPIIETSEPDYFTSISHAVMLLQDQIQSITITYFGIVTSCGILLVVIWIVFLLMLRSHERRGSNT